MYWLYADGLRAFFLTVRFAFGLTVAGLEEPWESAALITRPISSSVNDNRDHLSYQQQLIGSQLP